MDIMDIYMYTKNMSLLYVEDNQNLLEAKMDIFKEIFKNADSAKNGLEGLEKYTKDIYDIVVTDINMPYMDGIEMIDNILHINNNQSIIIISAYLEAEYTLKLKKFKKIDFLTKPVGADELLTSIFEASKLIKSIEAYHS